MSDPTAAVPVRAVRTARRRLGAGRRLAAGAGRRIVHLPATIRDRGTVRQRNAEVLEALRQGEIPGADETALTGLRALDLLRHRAAAAEDHPRTGRLLRSGLEPWTARSLGLIRIAEAAAAEALQAERLATAAWLADRILDSAVSQRAQRIRGLVAAHHGDWDAVRVWQRRRLAVPAGEPSPQADAWVAREVLRVRTRRLYRLFAEEGSTGPAAPGGATATGPDPETRWARAVQAEGPEAVVLQALAVADALRIGSDSRRTRRYEESFLADRITEPAAAAGGYLPLAHAFAARPQGVTLASPELARSVRSIGVHNFRNFLAGKSICLIANSPRLLGSGLGGLIDGYDLVMRFNSFALAPEDTGARTDIHVTIHLHDYNFDVPVPVRIVLSGDPALWIESVKRRVRPGAQQWLGDGSLRWPARDLGLISPQDPFRTPTAGFNLLRLLLHLDVSPVIDLIGFDFYESGKLRLKDAMDIPHSTAHNSGAERDWVMARATATSPMVISMRAPAPDTAAVVR